MEVKISGIKTEGNEKKKRINNIPRHQFVMLQLTEVRRYLKRNAVPNIIPKKEPLKINSSNDNLVSLRLGLEQLKQENASVEENNISNDTSVSSSTGMEQLKQENAPVDEYNISDDTSVSSRIGPEKIKKENAPVDEHNFSDDTSLSSKIETEKIKQEIEPVLEHNSSDDASVSSMIGPEEIKQEDAPIDEHNLSDDTSESSIIGTEEIEQENAPVDEDRIDSYDELIVKLSSECLPPNVILKKLDDRLLFYSLSYDRGPVQPYFTVIVKLDLSFELYSKEIFIDNNAVNHLTSNKIKSVSSLLKVLAYMNSFKSLELEKSVNEAINTLKVVIDKQHATNQQKLTRKKLNFIIQQLEILEVKPSRRRYTPELLATAMIWNNISPVLYKKLQEDQVLTLPPQKRLSKTG
ncbi:unnamed protein product [Lepeophtheirus salmonis]|uniref:(salmon louse) hypothetical protein n=1 Tax=Lepeophtheirus salmonis TaxID=72036 RepID=A0A7R8D0N8_LEPSM|nr:unnamed protein product [Lepeophtheirus salmonis]CAF2943235.1 unnamed protein product [Lepeophtheirus salmonis]